MRVLSSYVSAAAAMLVLITAQSSAHMHALRAEGGRTSYGLMATRLMRLQMASSLAATICVLEDCHCSPSKGLPH